MIKDFPGNYSQYRLWLSEQEKIEDITQKAGNAEKENKKAKEKKQLSYKEKREFELLEKEIKDLNREKNLITEKLNSGDTSFEELQQLSNRIGVVTNLLDEKELRWLKLSEQTE